MLSLSHQMDINSPPWITGIIGICAMICQWCTQMDLLIRLETTSMKALVRGWGIICKNSSNYIGHSGYSLYKMGLIISMHR